MAKPRPPIDDDPQHADGIYCGPGVAPSVFFHGKKSKSYTPPRLSERLKRQQTRERQERKKP